MSINYMGPSLKETQEDMRILPLPVLAQYVQNPQNMTADGVGFSLIALTELARRRRLEDAAAANQQPDPSRVPTIAEGLMYGQTEEAGGVATPKTGIAAFAQPTPAPAPAAPTIVAAAPAPAPAAPTIATPYSSPKIATAGPTVKRAHGGIIAFNGEERSDVPKQEPLRRQYPKEFGVTNPVADFLSTLGELVTSNRRRDRPEQGKDSESKVQTSGISEAAMGELGFNTSPVSPLPSPRATPAPTASTTIAKPASKPIARPAVAPTPTAPAAPAAPVASTEPDAFAEAMKVLGAPPATLTPEQAEAARKQAQERLSGITDPRMAEIRRLQAEAEGIGSRRDAGAMNRAMMQFGLRMAQGGSRPGTAGSAVAGAGLEALSSYEKEQTGMIERALKTNQIKIELEKELMKQGVDRNTAADLAEREARKQVADVEREKGDRAKDRGALAIQKQQANTALERAQNQLTIAEMRVNEAIRRSESQAVINALSAQVRTAAQALRELQARTPTVEEKRKVDEVVEQNWPSVKRQYLSPEIVRALDKGLSKDPAVMAAEAAAKQKYAASFFEGTLKAPPPIDADTLMRSLSKGQ